MAALSATVITRPNWPIGGLHRSWGTLSFRERPHWLKEQNSHLHGWITIWVCALYTHTHTRVDTHSPPYCRHLYNVAGFPMMNGWVWANFHSPITGNPIIPDHRMLVFFREFLEDGIFGLNNSGDSSVTALWLTHQADMVLSFSTFPGTATYEQDGSRGEGGARREGRISIRSVALRCRICLLKERSIGSHESKGGLMVFHTARATKSVLSLIGTAGWFHSTVHASFRKLMLSDIYCKQRW